MRLKAIIFDVDGTLAETEETHRAAFNRAFSEAGLDWHWTEDDYRDLLRTTGGKERITRYMAERGVAPDPALVVTLHQRKNNLYAELVSSGAIKPRPSILALINEARGQGIPLAIATTTSRTNLSALLAYSFSPDAEGWFAAIVTGEDVAAKKPDPEVYRRALDLLALDASDCIAIEDTRNGVEAAATAGIFIIVTPSRYSSHEWDDDPSSAAVTITVDGLDEMLRRAETAFVVTHSSV